LGDAASAYGSLGDEFGQPGTPSLGDRTQALASYRKVIEIDNRALRIDPGFVRAQRGLAIMQIKIGSAVMDVDPEQALKEFKTGLQRTDALSAEQQSSFPTMRLRAVLLRKEADALSELGRYSEANPIYAQDTRIYQKFADQDPDDLRALFDVATVLDDAEQSYENAADPALHAPGTLSPAERRKNLETARTLLAQMITDMETLLKHDPTSQSWLSNLANAQWRMATLQHALGAQADSIAIGQKGIGTLKELAKSDQAPPTILDQAAIALISVEPASLRDPQLAVRFAEREVAQSQRKTPSHLYTLAQTYEAAGQTAKAHATAAEALALLPPSQPSTGQSRIRKQLEAELSATR